MLFFLRVFIKLSNDIQLDSLGTCCSLVIDVSSLQNFWNLKNRFFNFSGTERVKEWQTEELFLFL